MATITDSFAGVNSFQNITFTSSKTITTSDTYEITLNASFSISWGVFSVTGGQSVSLISGGGSSSTQAVYRVTNLASGAQTFSVATSGSTTAKVNFTVSAPSITAPVISSVTNNNASAADVTTTVNLSSNGSGGTLKYAQTTSNSVPATGWQTSANFTHPRNSIRYYWASQDEDTSGTFDSSGAVYVGYIAPDTAVSPSNATIAYNDTSASITITGVTSGETYQLRNQAGTTSYQSGVASGTSITISQTGGLPSVGSTLTYQVYSLRPTNLGGDGAYDATGDTYTITRGVAPPTYTVTAPASINEGSSGTINISTTNVSNGTVLYWSVSTGDTPVDFDSPAAGSVTISSNAASFTVTPTADATTEGAETATVTVRTGSQAGTIVATDTFTINDTSQYPVPTTPTDISFAADPGTASATVSIACTASGGANGTLQVSQDNTNWVANGSSFTFTRGTAKTIYARRTGAGGTSSSYSESNTVGYLQPDLAVAATSSTITFNATSASTTVSGGQSAETYAVRVNNGSTNLGTRTGNGSITFTSSLPSVGNTTTYEIFARRPVSTGGDGSTYYQTNDTFTVTRSVESVTAPTDIVFGTSSAASATVSITATASGGSGGTLQVSENNSTWVANGSSFTFTRGTAKTIYARRSGTGSNSSSYSESNTVGYLQPDLAVAATSSTISSTATSATTTISGGQSAETYAVRVNNGTTNLGTRTGNGDISFTSSLPSSGNTATYEIFARRPVSTGGDGSTFYATDDTFTVTKQSSAGGTGSVGGGSSTYGVEVFDNDGTSKVLAPTTRLISKVAGPTSFSLAAEGNAGDNALFSVDMTDLTTSNSDVVFPLAATAPTIVVSRETNGFRLTNTSTARTVIAYVIRF